ncbi:MAG: ribosome biogenesis GTPase Der [SAR86 cluster bacterium]|uniref:GTPase Der n=1 Tax=SAR86 cluster bacterium TaxID=2030880 RepID=A0A368BNE3_9GAMM|nr:MAG: ribosome biogenesis GTPase Der [Gammaproteobacteria bacterium TMED219]RCL38800.1 MAG: ribosome biogenesis GTPase Der [SAR86 cluster bacterium]|tara:strand:- start:243 stop:1550 length:1308 start_codon:yes stop_codon:yes gene_type:complete
MRKTVTLVGRTNVGKSSIFNRLIGSNKAIVSDYEGLTRDRKISTIDKDGISLDLIDTGGFFSSEEDQFEDLILYQAHEAINSSDLIIFVVDNKFGLSPYDNEIASILRKSGKEIILVINKIDVKKNDATDDFAKLGFKDIYSVSAAHNKFITELRNEIFKRFSQNTDKKFEEEAKITIIGKPNVGKSSTINSLIDSDRLIVSDTPGTTVDSIDVEVNFRGKNYLFYDTAGVRRKSKVIEKEEKYSVIKSFDALEKSDLCLFLLDPKDMLSDQDFTLLSKAKDIGKAIIIAVNKADLLKPDQKKSILKQLFEDPATKEFPIVFISAKEKRGMRNLFDQIFRTIRNIDERVSTNKLNKILRQAIEDKSVPFKGKFKPKLRYIHQGSKNPHTFIIHGNSLDRLEGSYKKYILNKLTKELALPGLILRLKFLSSKNPFK